ncbi:MAG TPA: FAD:protein FMN transferase [Gemmataceae bacterium]|nr:FAD:protein FMN transferase [Gemmataceae bacterium]
MRLLFILTGLTATLAAGAGRAEPALTRFTFHEVHMGTEFKIILYAPDQETAGKAAAAAFARVADLDATMTDYQPTSELMRLCAKSGGDPVHVSDELFFVLSQAQETSRISDGAFDVTVGPVVRLWRQARRTGRMPDSEKLAVARALVGWKNVVLDEKAHTVQLLKAGMQLDLGGIAKGYAADEGIAVLKKFGVIRALVAAGGDIAVSGPPPDAEGWKIAIAPLQEDANSDGPTLTLHDAAVSTSGDAEQYVEIDGKRYSHIVDPKTGIGLVGRMSGTIVAPKGIIADSHTKIVCVLGPEKAFPILEKEDGVSARFVHLSDDGKEETAAMKNFPPLTNAKDK